jgi:hypothetical protein
MRTSLTTSALVLLVLALPAPCDALTEVEDVTKERAKALGLVMRVSVAGKNEVQVTLEFRTKGELAKFSHVELDIVDGKKRLVSVTLEAKRPEVQRVVVSFSADRALLAKSTLSVVANMPDGRVLFRLPVMRFVEADLKQLTSPVQCSKGTGWTECKAARSIGPGWR